MKVIYNGCQVNVLIKHNRCGYLFECTPDNHKRGKGCPRCKTSKGEKMVINFLILQELTINEDFTMQKKFENCMNKKYLPFDIFIRCDYFLNKHDKYNRIWIIEYDGEQHTRPVKRFGGIDKFIKLVMNDSIKNKYCKDNNISLIRIPYTINTQEDINLYLEDKIFNSTLEELNDHNKNLEKQQQDIIRKFKN